MRSFCKHALVCFLPNGVLPAPKPHAGECTFVVSSITVGTSGSPLYPAVSSVVLTLDLAFTHVISQTQLSVLLMFFPSKFNSQNHRIVKNACMTLGRCFHVQVKQFLQELCSERWLGMGGHNPFRDP